MCVPTLLSLTEPVETFRERERATVIPAGPHFYKTRCWIGLNLVTGLRSEIHPDTSLHLQNPPLATLFTLSKVTLDVAIDIPHALIHL